jgi:hypothetical protein
VVAAVAGVVVVGGVAAAVAATNLHQTRPIRTQVAAVECAAPRTRRTLTSAGIPDPQPVLVGTRRDQG